MRLVATNQMNDFFPVNYTVEIAKITATSNTLYTIPQYSDCVIFDGLVIPESVDLKTIEYIEFKTDDIVLYNIPFDVILADCTIKTVSNNYNITFPDNFMNFTNDKTQPLIKSKFRLPIVALEPVHIVMKSTTNFDYHIIVNNLCYQQEPRRNMATELLDFNIYQYQQIQLEASGNTTLHGSNAKFISSGFYLKLNSPLVEYEIIHNGHPCGPVSKEIIDYYSFLKYSKDSTYIYYIPFNFLDSTDGTVNFTRIDVSKINIKTKNNDNTGVIYIKNINSLLIKNKKAVIRFVKQAGYLYEIHSL